MKKGKTLNFMNCTVEESDFIISEINKLADKDKAIVEVKILFDGMELKYMQNVLEWLNKYPVNKMKFEEKIYEYFNLEKNIRINKVKGDDCLYCIELEELIYSSMIIFSYLNGAITVMRRTNNYIQRSKSVENKLYQIKNKYPNILTTTESIDYIIENRCSLARFGDGELNLCYGIDIGFQKYTKELQSRLKEILKHGCSNKVLVTMPEFNSKHNNIVNCVGDLTFWENYWFKMYDNLQGFIIQDFYGNTDISRNSVFYENELIDIKKLWDKRDVVFVIGDKGRFEIKQELFDNLLSYEIIFVPPVNAFEKYDEIYERCLNEENKDKLFLISTGPTATILAFDLMKKGFQAFDIGHLPNCYDQYLGRIKYPESIPFIRPISIPYSTSS